MIAIRIKYGLRLKGKQFYLWIVLAGVLQFNGEIKTSL